MALKPDVFAFGPGQGYKPRTIQLAFNWHLLEIMTFKGADTSMTPLHLTQQP